MSDQTTQVIFNPAAGREQDRDELLERLGRLGTVHTTKGPGDARRLARDAAAGGAGLVVAAGGDGTVNEVVSGLAPGFEAALAVVPLGTGNDLAGTLGMPDDPLESVAVVAAGPTVAADVIRLRIAGEERWAVNAVTAGFSALVDEVLESRSKELLGSLAYLVTAGRSLPELEAHRLRLSVDDGDERVLDAFNLVLANGPTVGGGVPVAAGARLDDGVLHLLVVPEMPLPTLAVALGRLFAGGGGEVPELHVEPVRKVRFAAEPAMQVTADGEVVGRAPAQAEVLPGALRCVIGRPPGRAAG